MRPIRSRFRILVLGFKKLALEMSRLIKTHNKKKAAVTRTNSRRISNFRNTSIFHHKISLLNRYARVCVGPRKKHYIRFE